MLKKSSFYAVLLYFSFTICNAQEVLTVGKALQIALENNFDIKIAEQQTNIATQQIYRGNAGMSPIIDYNLNVGTNGNYVNQRFFDGRTINQFGRSFSPNTNVSLFWTLYDGRLMQTRFETLKSQGQRQLAQQQLTVQNTLVNVMQTYYELLLQNQSLKYLNTIIKFYEERLNITKQRWEFGRGSKLDYLQSQSDLTTQRSTYTLTENALKAAKIQLNTLLNREPDVDFEVQTQDTPALRYDLYDLLADAKNNNREILLLQKELEIAKLGEQSAESFLKPRIDLNSSFGYSFASNNAGFVVSNQNTGLNVGVTARWNIFNGQQTRRNIQIAKMNIDAVELQQKSLLQQVTADVVTAYNQYVTDEKIEEIEEANQKVTEENLKISLEKFKLGGSTILELIEAQRSYDISLNRLVNARFNRQVSEVDLLRLSGQLVK
ncbi:MAG: TolC family protein [Spirosomaceae bacterium]|nr:TolC family protein [Spirosomataceae bacterium]